MHVQGSSHGARLPDDRYLFYVRHEGRQNPGTVAVFESGLGGTRSYWAATQQLLAGELTTVAYDRAGLGRSSPTQHYSLPHRAADLTALLDHVLRPGQKAILVGHSWGGPIIRVAAAARPARIAGLILVDPTDEACDLYFSKAARRLERLGLLLSVPMAITGLNRLGARTFLSRFPDEAAADMRAEAFTVAAARAYRGELRTLSRDLASLKQTRPDPEGFVTTIISAAQPSPGINESRVAALQAAHRVRAEATGARHVLAHRSGHLVPLLEPQVIVDEIRRTAETQPTHGTF
ncbi:alpha/beta fold hydrolase [Kineosporia succinea]|uniref:Pimeloyl-ACP methyl ester carboxylesterase n=1 Tax=Kineosporia succinea TaxID=84632 RepID=A0ABT9P462_9ACTN|nr:alpha/beta hydrolase [Kineosporia succinea]MDP9827472.1 pimeloyl-ACP methyl ester carboxylesterase [Kineosporia succinea]